MDLRALSLKRQDLPLNGPRFVRVWISWVRSLGVIHPADVRDEVSPWVVLIFCYIRSGMFLSFSGFQSNQLGDIG